MRGYRYPRVPNLENYKAFCFLQILFLSETIGSVTLHSPLLSNCFDFPLFRFEMPVENQNKSLNIRPNCGWQCRLCSSYRMPV